VGHQAHIEHTRPQLGRNKTVERRKVSQIKREVFIACPVCFSGSHFQLERPERELACDGCGFVFARGLELNISESEECIFCGSRYFYFEAPLDLSFLGLASICYVCEARYKGIGINHPDEKYNQGGARDARRSGSALRWRERVTRYGQRADL
jgi:hypothetical protein